VDKKITNVETPNVAGYPQTDIGKAGTLTKGRWMSGTKQKEYMDTRGSGAATSGKKFLKG
jgi:hypothetical protein